MLIAWLHLIQPLARLLGRVRHGVTPWRWSGLLSRPVRLRYKRAIWSEEWQPIETRLAEIERVLFRKRAAVKRGGDFDRWDLEVRGGLLGQVRAVGMIEEHGAGKQLFRLRAWPQIPARRSGCFFFLAFFPCSLLTMKLGLPLLRSLLELLALH